MVEVPAQPAEREQQPLNGVGRALEQAL